MPKIKTSNKRAFTLTELLIVVIVIGVLSAVTLPKFNRVIENRKVTEAEEMMSAVRTEQERRCSLDKNYTMKFDNLSDVIASNNTKNYTYSLQNQGISAQSKSSNYTLKILSYQDGDFCCEGAGCDKLNKNYPKCADMNPTVSACVGTDGGTEVTPDPVEPETPECADGQVKGSQVCNGCGTQTTQKCVSGKWTASLGTCSKTAAECAPECTDGDVSGSQECNGCGTQTTQKCVDGKWTASLGTCSKAEAECTTCPEGKVLENGVCVCEESLEKGLCSGEVTCGDGSTSVLTWNEDTCQCEDSCPKETTEFYNLVCSRADYWKASMNVNTHLTKDAAQNACEKYGQDVSFCILHKPTSNCSDPNKPCEVTEGWGECYACSQEKCSDGGLGTCSTCNCICYVG